MPPMLDEATSAPDRVADLLAADGAAYADLGRSLRADPPRFAITLARGSSDAAASWFAYVAAQTLGIVTASLPPSLVTLADAPLRVEDALLIAVSQSGRSPDLVEPMRVLAPRARDAIAIVNDTGSPLALAARRVLGLHAGPERAVAATKSHIASVVALARLVAAWSEDAALTSALAALPERLREAVACDWRAAVPVLQPVQRLFVVARGPGLPIAVEMALKLKELCGIHAEAVSAAEVLHGPKAIVGAGDPVLLLVGTGAAGESVRATAAELQGQGARPVCIAHAGSGAADLPLPPPLHPALDPLLAVQAFYPMAAALAHARGLDPDAPRHLAKVTLTR